MIEILGDKFDIIEKTYDISESGNFEGVNIFTEKENIKLNSQELIELEIAKEILKAERDNELNLFLIIKYKQISIVFGYTQILSLHWQ